MPTTSLLDLDDATLCRIFHLASGPCPFPWSTSLRLVCRESRRICRTRQTRYWFCEFSTLPS